MSSKNNKKKLKMERLSPIPALGWSHPLADSMHTPIRPARRRQKDAYAIEITSSPEFGQPPAVTDSSSLQKQRRIRNIARSKVPKKPNSTPLSGLISRKAVNVAPKETHHFSDPSSSPNSTQMPSRKPCERSLLGIPEELPRIDDYSPQKPAHSPRHSEMISASTIFPQKPQPSTSNTTPLAGIVNRKGSSLNRSLNDSILVLREADDPSDDDDISSNASSVNPPKCEVEKVGIESFESPRKPPYVLPKEHTTAASIFKNFRSHLSRNLIMENLNKTSPIIENSSSSSGEMCGNERKNRKRALDFNSTAFMVTSDGVVDGRPSPIPDNMSLSRESVDRQSPVLSLDRDRELTIPYLKSPSRDSERGCRSPILNIVPQHCERGGGSHSPTFNLNSPSGDTDRSPTDILKPKISPLINFMPLRHARENRLSPVLNVTSVEREPKADRQSPILNVKSPSHDSDHLSLILYIKPPKTPVLTLMPSRHDSAENAKSPVLNVMTLDDEPDTDSRSPIPNSASQWWDPEADRQSPILNFKPSKSRNLNLIPFSSFRSKEAHSEPLKSAKCPEIKPHAENELEECLSDTDSVIESTPRPSEKRNPCSDGFTASSCLKIENDTPSNTGKVDYTPDEFDNPKIVEIPEETSTAKGDEICDLRFVVVSHETSPDESVNDADVEVTKNYDDIIFPTIDGRHSPLDLNYTKRPIQSFESPSKASKPFSEAVNIGAFGSPDSNASYGDQQDVEVEDRDGTDEVIEPSTTQEYIEESEQVRPTKRRKKGSLLERVKGVIAKVDASNALFDYEMKCGLRPAKGKFVSAPLVILKQSGEPKSLFLVCKPLKYCGSSSHVEDIQSFVIVHSSKLPSGACDGSVIMLHFPINVMYVSNLHIPYALAGHQIVLHPTEQKIDIRTIDASSLATIDSFNLAYSKPMTSFKTFSSAQLRTLSEAALCQNLVEESNLYLTVLHLTKLHVEAILKKISVLCCDEESQFCWLEFSSEQDIRRAAALEALQILSDGSQVQTKGFSVTGRVRLERKSKNLISYCSNNTVNNEIIFSVHPKESNWVISSTDGVSEVKKVRSSISDILSKKIAGCRYLLEVHGIEKEPQIMLKDSRGQSVHFVIGENSCLNLDHPAPFFLDGLYWFDDKLFSDEHTRMIPIA